MPRADTGRWVCGLIHMHSTHSDGKQTLEELKQIAQDRGFGFMIVTDHIESIPRIQAYADECLALSSQDFPVIPGVEIATGWALPNGQDESTAHTLALGITDSNGAVVPCLRSGGTIGNWVRAANMRLTTYQVLLALEADGVLTAAAHQFQYGQLAFSLSDPLRGSDYRYDMAVMEDVPGTDFHYRTVLEVNHEPEDLALYGGLVARWHAAWPADQSGPPSEPPMPWAYAGADYHAGAKGLPSFLPPVAAIADEQLTHANWVYVEGGATPDAILASLRAGRTCATRGRSNNLQDLIGITPVPGIATSIPQMPTPHLELDLVFPKATTRPLFVQIYRNGIEASEMLRTYHKGIRHLSISWPDDNAPPGLHAYVIVIAGKLVTSPILIRKAP